VLKVCVPLVTMPPRSASRPLAVPSCAVLMPPSDVKLVATSEGAVPPVPSV
jgi:hypothetical protein